MSSGFGSDNGGFIGGSGTGGVATGLQAANNLSDVASVPQSRINLGIDKLTFVGNTNYTILATDKVVATSAAFTAPRTWTLPAANSVAAGYEIIVMDEFGTLTSVNSILVTRTGTDLISGAVTESIAAPYAMRRFISDGVNSWTFDKGVLRASNNLSDLTDAATARQNLGITAATGAAIGAAIGLRSATVDAKVAADTTIFTPAVGEEWQIVGDALLYCDTVVGGSGATFSVKAGSTIILGSASTTAFFLNSPATGSSTRMTSQAPGTAPHRVPITNANPLKLAVTGPGTGTTYLVRFAGVLMRMV